MVGRKRLPEEKKKVNVNISITKEVVDELKEKGVNISNLAEESFANFLQQIRGNDHENR